MMNREGKDVRGTTKEITNRLAAVSAAQFAAVPDSIFGEKRGDRVSVVIIVTGRRIARL